MKKKNNRNYKHKLEDINHIVHDEVIKIKSIYSATISRWASHLSLHHGADPSHRGAITSGPMHGGVQPEGDIVRLRLWAHRRRNGGHLMLPGLWRHQYSMSSLLRRLTSSAPTQVWLILFIFLVLCMAQLLEFPHRLEFSIVITIFFFLVYIVIKFSMFA